MRPVRCAGQWKAVTKTFSWHHPALYLVALAAVLIYVIVAVIVRKSIRLTVPLCVHHAQQRSLAVNMAWVIPLIGVADAFILPRFGVSDGWVILIVIAAITGLSEKHLQQFPTQGI